MPTTLLLAPPDFQIFLGPCFVQNFNQFFNKDIFSNVSCMFLNLNIFFQFEF